MSLLDEVKSCQHCVSSLPLPPRPVLNFSTASKVLVVGQAPGIIVHNTGIPWNDKSGERLRDWLGVSPEEFYDVKKFAIVPMGFCYPGKGKSGDLPPRKECSQLWMKRILNKLEKVQLTLLIGQYAQQYFLHDKRKKTLTDTVKNWEEYWPKYVVLPHPSPRNNIWLKKNPWFEDMVIPKIKNKIKTLQTSNQPIS